MNAIDLQGRAAVITGGAQGIGFAVAQRLVASGASVSLWDMNAAILAEAKAALGEAAVTVQVNITDYDAVVAAVAQTEEALGQIDILVNSAGIAGKNAPLDEYELDEWRRVIDIDLNGTFYVNRAVLPGMKARNYGRIVNSASIAGKEGNPNAAAYAARHVAKNSRLPDYPQETTKDLEHVALLAERIGKNLEGMRAARDVTKEQGDDDTFDLLTKIIEMFEKHAWFLHSTLDR